MEAYRRYIWVNSLSGFLYFFVLISPFYAAERGIELPQAGWIFGAVFAIQAFLSYTVGKVFEKLPPSWGIITGRAIYSLGPLILAFESGIWWFAVAQIAASFFDVFFPSIVLYERAIIPPDRREEIYRKLIVASEGVKIAFLVFFVLSYLRGWDVYRAVFLSMFTTSIVYILSFVFFLPRVRSGMEGASEFHDKRSFLFIYLSQLFTFLSFNFASWMIISYYLKEVLGGRNIDIVYFEFFFSVPIVLTYPVLSRVSSRLSLRVKFFTGGVVMAGYFFFMMIPRMWAFYLAHVFLGVGFPVWLPAKETLKFQAAPAELGRWEGFFQGVNIFSRIVFPPISAYLAQSVSYAFVFLIGGLMAGLGALMALGVRE